MARVESWLGRIRKLAAVIGVVLGSIYGGISEITEAAGMGALAVFIVAVFRGEASVALLWDSLMRTLKSTGTIIWVTVGAATLAGPTRLLAVQSTLRT